MVVTNTKQKKRQWPSLAREHLQVIIESEEEETKIPLLEEKRHAKKVQLRIELNIFEDAAEARRHNEQQMQQLTREAMILLL